jgi:hypothetical protein
MNHGREPESVPARRQKQATPAARCCKSGASRDETHAVLAPQFVDVSCESTNLGTTNTAPTTQSEDPSPVKVSQTKGKTAVSA